MLWGVRKISHGNKEINNLFSEYTVLLIIYKNNHWLYKVKTIFQAFGCKTTAFDG